MACVKASRGVEEIAGLQALTCTEACCRQPPNPDVDAPAVMDWAGAN